MTLRYAVNYATMDSGSEYRILFTNYILLGALVTRALSPQDYRVADFKAAASDAFWFRFWGASVVAMLCNVVAIIYEPVVIVQYLVISPKWTDSYCYRLGANICLH